MKNNLILRMALALSLSGTLMTMGCGSSESASADDSQAQTADASNDSSVPFASRGSRAAAPSVVAIPAGTNVSVRLAESVSSASAAGGQHFETTLAEALVVNGQTIAPRGASATGRVVEARKSGRLHNSGFLRLALSSIEVNGKMVPVQTSSVSASGGKYAKRNTAIIGGSAAGGALLGGLMGGGKGALIGAGVGAAGGTGAAAATGKKDVTFAAERLLAFRLTQPAQLR